MPKNSWKNCSRSLENNALIPFKNFGNLRWIVMSRLNRRAIYLLYLWWGRTYRFHFPKGDISVTQGCA